MTYEVRKPLVETHLTFYLQNLEGTRVLFSDVRDTDPSITERIRVGVHTFDVKIPPGLLASDDLPAHHRQHRSICRHHRLPPLVLRIHAQRPVVAGSISLGRAGSQTTVGLPFRRWRRSNSAHPRLTRKHDRSPETREP